MISKSVKSFSVRKMAIVGVLSAISAILGLTPLGFIPVGPTKATIMHIPVIIGAIVEGPFVGALVGLMFGLFSMIQAIMYPTAISFVFLNPLVAVVPRILIGIVAYYAYAIFKKLGKKASYIVLSAIWACIMCYLLMTLVQQISNYSLNSISFVEMIKDSSFWMMIFNGTLVILTAIIGYFSYKKLKDKAIEVVISAMLGTLTNTIGVLSMIYLLYAEQFVEKIGGNTNIAGKIIMGIGITNGIPEIIVAILIVTGVISTLKNKSRGDL